MSGNALRELFATLNLELNEAQLATANASVDALKAKTEKGASVFATWGEKLREIFKPGGFLVGQLIAGSIQGAIGETKEFVKQSFEEAHALELMSKRLGVSTDSLQVMKALGAPVGVSLDVIQAGARGLARNLSDFARTGKGRAAPAFKDLGVEVTNADGSLRNIDAVMLDALASIGSMSDETQKLAWSQKIFGGAGLALVPMLQGTREEIDANIAKAREMGIVYDEDTIKSLAAAQIGLNKLRGSVRKVGVQFLASIAPAIAAVIGWFAKGATAVYKFVKQHKILSAVMAAFVARALLPGTKGIGRFLSGLKGIVPWIRKFNLASLKASIGWLALFLIAEDLYQLFTGGKSVIGDLIDQLFGVGSSAKFVQGVTEAFRMLLPAAMAVLSWIWEIIGPIIKGIVILVAMTTAHGKAIGELGDAFMKATEPIGQFFDKLFGWFGRAWDYVVGLLAKIGQLSGSGTGFDIGTSGLGAPGSPTSAAISAAQPIVIQDQRQLTVTANAPSPGAVASAVSTPVDAWGKDYSPVLAAVKR